MGLYPRGLSVLHILDISGYFLIFSRFRKVSAGPENSFKPPHRAA